MASASGLLHVSRNNLPDGSTVKDAIATSVSNVYSIVLVIVNSRGIDVNIGCPTIHTETSAILVVPKKE